MTFQSLGPPGDGGQVVTPRQTTTRRGPNVNVFSLIPTSSNSKRAPSNERILIVGLPACLLAQVAHARNGQQRAKQQQHCIHYAQTSSSSLSRASFCTRRLGAFVLPTMKRRMRFVRVPICASMFGARAESSDSPIWAARHSGAAQRVPYESESLQTRALPSPQESAVFPIKYTCRTHQL